jgi:hypothetical protein
MYPINWLLSLPGVFTIRILYCKDFVIPRRADEGDPRRLANQNGADVLGVLVSSLRYFDTNNVRRPNIAGIMSDPLFRTRPGSCLGDLAELKYLASYLGYILRD